MKSARSARMNFGGPSSKQSELDWRWGIHSVQESIRAGRAHRVWLGGKPPGRGRLATLHREATQAHVPVMWVTREELGQLSPGVKHQNAAAQVAPLLDATPGELVEIGLRAGHQPLILVLDQLQDPQNVGAILRTADAAGLDGVVVSERRSAPLGGVVSRASAGALEHLRIAEVRNISGALEELKELGLWILGLDPGASEVYDEADYLGPVALVVGTEGSGLRRLVAAKCDVLLRLPLCGKVESLNVSVATSVCLYHAMHCRRRGSGWGNRGLTDGEEGG